VGHLCKISAGIDALIVIENIDASGAAICCYERKPLRPIGAGC